MSVPISVNVINLGSPITRVRLLNAPGVYVQLGESDATAYRGDRGKIAYDHTLITTGNPHSVTKTDVGLSNVDNTADTAKPVSTAQQTALDLKQNILSEGAFINGDKTKLDSISSNADVNDPTTLLDADIGSTVQAYNALLSSPPSNFGAATTSVTTTTYTTLATDGYILANNAAGVAVTLLAAATAGDGFKIDIKRVGATGTITIDGNASETIDGALTATLTTQYESLTIVCDGSNWHII